MNPSAGTGRGKIFLIELSPSVPNLGRFIVMPRYGMLAIASILSERSDYDVSLLFEPFLAKIDIETIAREDPRFLFVNGLTTTADDNERFLARLRDRMGGAVTVIAGGEHATMFPEDAKRYADYLLAYEADDTVLPLLSALEERDPVSRDSLLSQIPGLHYRGLDGRWRFNQDSVRVERIDYRYDLSVVPGAASAGRRFRQAHIPLQTSRGCSYCCSFCSWLGLFGKSGYYTRPAEDVVHDIVHTVEYAGVRNFVVTDNLFAGDPAYTDDLMYRILRAFEGRSDRPAMTVLCRADQFAGGPGSIPEKTIRNMARAGVANVSLGLESISQRSLLQMRKRTDLQNYHAAAECLRRNGIGMLATFVAGFDGDRREDILNIAEFGERIGLFTVHIYSRNINPGTVDEFLSENRAIPGGLHKYRNGHGVHMLPAQMLPSDLQRAIFEASFAFHGRKDRGPAQRAFRAIWGSLAPHYEGLLRLEKEVLVPEGVYRLSDSRYSLNEKAPSALVDDPERYDDFARRAAAIFRNADDRTPVRSSHVRAAPAIA